MQPAQAIPPDAGLPDLRPIGHHLDAIGGQRRAETGGELARAKAIDQHPHGNAPPCGTRQRGGHPAPGRVVGKDVGFEVHLVRGRVDRGDQRRKIFATRFEQLHTVAGHKTVRGGGAPVDPHGTAAPTRSWAQSTA